MALYKNFGGVDFSTEFCEPTRFSDLKNMLKTYEETDGKFIETRKGLVKLFTAPNDGIIYGIHFYNNGTTTEVLVHAGTKLYKWNNFPEVNDESGDTTEKYAAMNEHKSNGVIVGGELIIQDGDNYLYYSSGTVGNIEDSAFVPYTTINARPGGSGTSFQLKNVLTGEFWNTFLGNDSDTVYQMDETSLTSVDSVYVDDVLQTVTTHYTVNLTNGTITFLTAPDKPSLIGQANVKIKVTGSNSNEDRIKHCTIMSVFDGRIFFSGNSDEANALYYTAFEDASYIPDLNKVYDGLDTSAIVSMTIGLDTLWTFKEENQAGETVFYHRPVEDYDYGKIYPSVHSKGSVGCIGASTNFRDDIVFLNKEGLSGISGDIEKEVFLNDRSSNVDARLVVESNYVDAIIKEWKDYILIYVNGHMYLGDGKQAFDKDGHLEYEWYYFDSIGSYNASNVFSEANLIEVYDEDIYIGCQDGTIAKYEGTNDYETAIESYAVTNRNAFGKPNRQKVTNKKGWQIKVKSMDGEMKVAFKAAKGNVPCFEYMDKFCIDDTVDYVVPKARIKKFTDLRIKLYSDKLNKPFGFSELEFEVFLGSYRKR